jgi:hypothetical protein
VGNDCGDQGSLLHCVLRSVQPTGRTPLEETSVVGLRKRDVCKERGWEEGIETQGYLQ